MSVTTIQNPASRTVLQALADYDLHHSGEAEQPQASRDLNTTASPSTANPHWWPTDHNRIPPHRPINRNLDFSQRPDGLNTIERIFIFTMLNGCGINANAARLWRNTGGRINDRIFYYKIGGEK